MPCSIPISKCISWPCPSRELLPFSLSNLALDFFLKQLWVLGMSTSCGCLVKGTFTEVAELTMPKKLQYRK